MPGNEVGDRFNNFFQQANLSRGQHQTKTVEDSWHGFNNNQWGGHDRQISGAGNLRIYNVQQSGSDRGQGNQSSISPYGLNIAESNIRNEFAKSQWQNQQLILNGFPHRPHVTHTVQNEANNVGVDTEPAECNLTSRGMSTVQQQKSASQHSNVSSASLGAKEPAINFDLLGRQQQMSAQQQGVLRSLAQQQSGTGDDQLLQQQLTLKQMQELQRQRQIQQLEAMQRNTMNQISSLSNQAVGNHAPSFINGTPMHDASNYPWPSQVMAGSPSWLLRGASPAMLGSANGVVMPPEQGQSLQMMGLIPQQAPQSWYGVPVSNARSGGGFLMNQVDKAGLHQVPIQGNFFGNEHPSLTEQMNMRDGMTPSRQGFEGKGSFEFTTGQGSGDAISVDNSNQMKQRSVLELGGQQDISVSPAHSLPDQNMEQVAHSQAPVALDPTEEKILFGTDDNMWDAFGGSLSGNSGGLDQSHGAFPSLQSGSWSALMQSAVAESSGSDVGLQGEWNGVGVHNSGTLTGNQQHSEGGKEWLGCSQPMAVAEESQSHESAYFSGDFSSKNTTASWSHQQRTSSSANRFGGLKLIQSLSDGDKMSKDQEKVQINDSDRVMYANIGDGGRTYLLSAGPNSKIEMERQQINSKDDVRISDNNHQQDFWRSVSSDLKSGGDVLGTYQHLDKGMQRVLHSSMNSYDRMTEMPETGSGDKRENSGDSYCSNLSNCASTGGMRKSAWLDVGDTHAMSGGKHNSSVQVGQNYPGPCRFDYQPMEKFNKDVEHSYKDIIQSHVLGNLHSGVPKGHGVQSRFLFPSTSNSPDLEKSPLSHFQGDIRASYGISPNCINPSYVSATPTFVDTSAGIPTPNSFVTSSQNMLELLQKVDKSKVQSTMINLNSNDHDRPSSTSDKDASDRNAAYSPKHSFPSQGFGLQLAPPAQGCPAPNFVGTSKNLSHTVNSPSLSYDASDKGEKPYAWSAPAASGESLSSVHVAHQVETQVTGSDIPGQIHESFSNSMQGDFPASFSSGSLYRKTLLHNQQMADAGVKVNFDQPGNVCFDRQVSHDKQMISAARQEQSTQSCTDLCDTQVSMQQMAALDVPSSLQPPIMPGMYQKGNLSSTNPNLWTNMLPQQLLAGQSLNAAELLKNQFQSNNIPGTGTSIQQEQHGEDTMKKGDALDSQGFVGVVEQRRTDASLPNSAATKNNIEAFDRSLKPNSSMVDNYSLLHQMQAMKDVDPNIRQVKRFKGLDSGLDDHYMAGKSEHSGGLNYVDKIALARGASVSSADAKMPSFTPEPGNENEKHIQDQHAHTPSQDLLSHQGEPQKLHDSNVAPRSEHSQISLQMAPTWFKQYGTFKNGQLLQVHDVQRAQMVANTEQQFMIKKSLKDLRSENTLGQVNTVVDTGQVANVWQKAPHVPTEHLSSLHPSASSVTAPGIASIRPKKRKSATIDLLPWHKEVALGYQRLPNMSSAEEDWAQAAHRLVEKIEDETDVHEDVSPRVRSRRRLVLTTQLMQQIFRPLPASILSLNASKDYETVAYLAARLALVDACSLACHSESDSCVSQDKENHPSEKPKANDRIDNQHLKKVMEQFTDRARILDNDLSRWDKRVSVLDLRLECQDLERFSVLNRFAKFHGRGQVDGTETSSSDATAAVHRARPQRYVNACPSLKNLPERVQCLSL